MRRKHYWNSLAPHYDGLYKDEWSLHEDLNTTLRLVSGLKLAPGNRVLDIGCGTGLALRLITDHGLDINYTGLDISESMLAILRESNQNVTTILGAAHEEFQKLPSNAFDYVISINAAASFALVDEDSFSQISRILKPSGRFHLSYLNRISLRRLFKLKIDRVESYRSRGDRNSSTTVPALTVTRSELLRQAESAGLGHLSVSYQSVLGGLAEHRFSLRAEKILSALAPGLGHIISLSGARTD